MRVAGSFIYDAPPAVMYDLFTNPDALKNATPGLHALRAVAPDRWEAEIKVGLGGFALVYHGTMTVTDRTPGEGYRIQIDARTQNGTARAECLLGFQPEEGGRARVLYEAKVVFEGGQKLLPAIARGLVDFFLYGMKEYLQHQQLRGKI